MLHLLNLPHQNKAQKRALIFSFARPLLLAYMLLAIVPKLCAHAQDSTNNNIDYYLTQAQQAEERMDTKGAIEAYSHLIRLCRREASHKKELPLRLYQYSIPLSYTANYNKAIEVLSEAQSLNNKQRPPHATLAAAISMQLGIIYFFQEAWPEALIHFTEAKAGAATLGNLQGVSIADNNIGNIYQKQGKYAAAIINYQACLQAQKQLNDSGTICNALFNLGLCHNLLQQHDSAIIFVQQAQRIANDINDIEIQTLSMIFESKALYRKGYTTKAFRLLHKAEHLASKTGYLQILTEVLGTKKTLLQKEGRYQEALISYERMTHIADSLSHNKLMEKIKALDIQNQTQKKEKKIAIQEIKLQASKKRMNFLIAFSSFLFTIILLLLFIWWQYRIQNKKLNKAIATKNKLFSIISHDLKTPAMEQKMAADMLSQALNTTENEHLSTYTKSLQQSSSQQLQLVQQLLTWTQLQSKGIKCKIIALDIDKLIQEEIKNLQGAAAHKHIRLLSACTQQIAKADKAMISTVLRNLISNAIKFAPSHSDIIINCKLQDHKLHISVQDTGMGLSSERLQLFNKENQSIGVRAGTNGEIGTGLGLSICKDILQRHHSRLQIDNNYTDGCKIFFVLNQ